MQIGGKAFKIIAAVLISLIGLTLLGSGAILIYRQFAGTEAAPAAVRSNVIRQEDSSSQSVQAVTSEAASTSTAMPIQGAASGTVSASRSSSHAEAGVGISLYKRHAEDNQTFQISGMMPGDRIAKEYEVEIRHQGEGMLSFEAKADDEIGALSEVLHMRITGANGGQVLYDGLIRELETSHLKEKLPAQTSGITLRRYRFEVYLPEESGNVYQLNRLTASWIWRAQATGDGELLPVTTGDFRFPAALMFAGLGLLCLTAMLLAPGLRRKAEAGKGESVPQRKRDAK